jgi:hypothetical protein
MSPSSGSSLPPAPRTTTTHNDNKTQNALFSQQTEKTLKTTLLSQQTAKIL